MKKILGTVIIAAISLCSVSSISSLSNPISVYASTDQISVEVDGESIDFSKYGAYPKIVDGTTYVPLRSVFEALGATEMEDKTSNPLGPKFADDPNMYMFQAYVGDMEIKFTVNIKERMDPLTFNSYYTADYSLGNYGGLFDFSDLDLLLEDGRTLIPVRGISEAFGYDVSWDGSSRTVLIDTSNPHGFMFDDIDHDRINEEIRVLQKELNVEDPNIPEFGLYFRTYEDSKVFLQYLKDIKAERENTSNTVTIEEDTETPSSVEEPITEEPITEEPITEEPVIEEPTYTTEDYIQGVFAEVNSEREAVGLDALVLDSKITEIAQIKAEDMANNGYFSHTSPTYGSPFEMLGEFGVSYMTAGENIAAGQVDAQDVMESWMNSKGHRENIQNSRFKNIGIGMAENSSGTKYWVQIFVTY
ncbi:MAG: CAP domain-containing protein [Lachnospirales bacterium]